MEYTQFEALCEEDGISSKIIPLLWEAAPEGYTETATSEDVHEGNRKWKDSGSSESVSVLISMLNMMGKTPKLEEFGRMSKETFCAIIMEEGVSQKHADRLWEAMPPNEVPMLMEADNIREGVSQILPMLKLMDDACEACSNKSTCEKECE